MMETPALTGALTLNGKPGPLDVATVAELLGREGIDPACRFLAVAVNGSVVLRAAWAGTRLAPGDAVEIVRPVSGG
jgi:sulfur carrier protein